MGEGIRQQGFPGGVVVKNPSVNSGDGRFNPWVGKILGRRKRQPSLVFLPGKSHGQRSLVGYPPLVGPWGHKELDTTEHTHHTH